MIELLFLSTNILFIVFWFREFHKNKMLIFKCSYYEEKLKNRQIDISKVKNANNLSELLKL